MSGAIIERSDVQGGGDVLDEADVVIVGSGAAGATAARVLTDAGVDVIVIEEGPHVRTAQRRSDMTWAFRQYWRDMGFQVARGRAFTPILQGRCVGGTTVINGAIIHRMPEAIHAEWCRDRGIGDALPYRTLSSIFDRLDDELGVREAPSHVFGTNNELMRRGVEGIGATGNAIRRNVVGCRGSAHCTQGCPSGRKQSMEATYVPRAVQKGARVYADCTAERIATEGGRARGVVGRYAGGLRLLARARYAVVVTASAIQTPLLLADSGIRSRFLGARLQAHPGTAVMGVFEQPVNQWFGATQGYESTHFWRERMKFEAVAMPLELGAVRLPGVGKTLVRRLREFGHVATWGVQVRARAYGRVSRGLFGEKRIAFDMTDEDVATLKGGVSRLVDMMFAAGAREVYPGVHGVPESIESPSELHLERVPNDPRYFHTIAAHLFGTAVMGQSPNDSVVGPSLESHALPGLYVLDSSVFPSNLGVNPQHSIAAVSWLAAERLAEVVHRARSRTGRAMRPPR